MKGRRETSEIEGIEGGFSSEVVVDEKDRTVTTSVKVVCGASAEKFDVAGQTIGAIRSFLSDALNIGSSTTALINGKAPKGGDNYKLKAGDELEFVKKSGTKG